MSHRVPSWFPSSWIKRGKALPHFWKVALSLVQGAGGIGQRVRSAVREGRMGQRRPGNPSVHLATHQAHRPNLGEERGSEEHTGTTGHMWDMFSCRLLLSLHGCV